MLSLKEWLANEAKTTQAPAKLSLAEFIAQEKAQRLKNLEDEQKALAEQQKTIDETTWAPVQETWHAQNQDRIGAAYEIAGSIADAPEVKLENQDRAVNENAAMQSRLRQQALAKEQGVTINRMNQRYFDDAGVTTAALDNRADSLLKTIAAGRQPGESRFSIENAKEELRQLRVQRNRITKTGQQPDIVEQKTANPDRYGLHSLARAYHTEAEDALQRAVPLSAPASEGSIPNYDTVVEKSLGMAPTLAAQLLLTRGLGAAGLGTKAAIAAGAAIPAIEPAAVKFAARKYEGADNTQALASGTATFGANLAGNLLGGSAYGGLGLQNTAARVTAAILGQTADGALTEGLNIGSEILIDGKTVTVDDSVKRMIESGIISTVAGGPMSGLHAYHTVPPPKPKLATELTTPNAAPVEPIQVAKVDPVANTPIDAPGVDSAPIFNDDGIEVPNFGQKAALHVDEMVQAMAAARLAKKKLVDLENKAALANKDLASSPELDGVKAAAIAANEALAVAKQESVDASGKAFTLRDKFGNIDERALTEKVDAHLKQADEVKRQSARDAANAAADAAIASKAIVDAPTPEYVELGKTAARAKIAKSEAARLAALAKTANDAAVASDKNPVLVKKASAARALHAAALQEAAKANQALTDSRDTFGPVDENALTALADIHKPIVIAQKRAETIAGAANEKARLEAEQEARKALIAKPTPELRALADAVAPARNARVYANKQLERLNAVENAAKQAGVDPSTVEKVRKARRIYEVTDRKASEAEAISEAAISQFGEIHPEVFEGVVKARRISLNKEAGTSNIADIIKADQAKAEVDARNKGLVDNPPEALNEYALAVATAKQALSKVDPLNRAATITEQAAERAGVSKAELIATARAKHSEAAQAANNAADTADAAKKAYVEKYGEVDPKVLDAIVKKNTPIVRDEFAIGSKTKTYSDQAKRANDAVVLKQQTEALVEYPPPEIAKLAPIAARAEIAQEKADWLDNQANEAEAVAKLNPLGEEKAIRLRAKHELASQEAAEAKSIEAQYRGQFQDVNQNVLEARIRREKVRLRSEASRNAKVEALNKKNATAPSRAAKKTPIAGIDELAPVVAKAIVERSKANAILRQLNVAKIATGMTELVASREVRANDAFVKADQLASQAEAIAFKTRSKYGNFKPLSGNEAVKTEVTNIRNFESAKKIADAAIARNTAEAKAKQEAEQAASEAKAAEAKVAKTTQTKIETRNPETALEDSKTAIIEPVKIENLSEAKPEVVQEQLPQGEDISPDDFAMHAMSAPPQVKWKPEFRDDPKTLEENRVERVDRTKALHSRLLSQGHVMPESVRQKLEYHLDEPTKNSTETPNQQFSIGDEAPVSGLDKARIEQIFDGRFGNGTFARSVKAKRLSLHNDPADYGLNPNTRGFYDKTLDIVRIFAKNVNEDNVHGVFLHEYSHSPDALGGEKAQQEIISELRTLAKTDPEAKAALEEARRKGGNTDNEMLTYFLQNKENSGREVPETLFEKISRGVRKGLGRFGPRLKASDPNFKRKILNLARASLKNQIQGSSKSRKRDAQRAEGLKALGVEVQDADFTKLKSWSLINGIKHRGFDRALLFEQFNKVIEQSGGTVPDEMNVAMRYTTLPDKLAGVIYELKPQIKTIVNLVKETGLNLRDVGIWGAIKYKAKADEIAGRENGSGVTQQFADAEYERLKVHAEKLDVILSKITDFHKQALEIRYKDGDIDKATYEARKANPDYVALRGYDNQDMHGRPEAAVARAIGTSVIGKPYLAELPRTAAPKFEDVFSHAVDDLVQAHARRLKNELVTTMMRFAIAHPNNGMISFHQPEMEEFVNKTTGVTETRVKHSSDTSILTGRVNGKEYQLQLKGRAAKTLASWNQKPGDFERIMSVPANLVNAAALKGVNYIGLQAVRDTQEIAHNLSVNYGVKTGALFVTKYKDSASALYSLIRGGLDMNNPLHAKLDEWIKNGGITQVNNKETVETLTENLRKQLAPVGFVDGAKGVGKAISQGLKPDYKGELAGSLGDMFDAAARGLEVTRVPVALRALDHLQMVGESIPRFAAYLALRETHPEMSIERATYATKEAGTNFSRKGSWAGKLGVIIPFYKAIAASGVSNKKIIASVFRNPKALAAHAAILATVAGFGGLNSIFKDDKDREAYLNISPHERATNFIIMYGGGPGEYLKLTLPQGIISVMNNFAQSAPIMAGLIERGDKPAIERLKHDFLIGMVNSIGPSVGDSGAIDMGFITKAIELAMNERMSGGQIHPEYGPGVSRLKETYGDAPVLAQYGAIGLSAIGPDWAPEQVEHVFSSIIPEWAKEANTTSQVVSGYIDRREALGSEAAAKKAWEELRKLPLLKIGMPKLDGAQSLDRRIIADKTQEINLKKRDIRDIVVAQGYEVGKLALDDSELLAGSTMKMPNKFGRPGSITLPKSGELQKIAGNLRTLKEIKKSWLRSNKSSEDLIDLTDDYVYTGDIATDDFRKYRSIVIERLNDAMNESRHTYKE